MSIKVNNYQIILILKNITKTLDKILMLFYNHIKNYKSCNKQLQPALFKLYYNFTNHYIFNYSYIL